MAKKVGRKPYGSKAGELTVIQRIRRWRNLHHGRHKSPYEIANLLNKQGVSPPAGERWYGTTVKNIISRYDRVKIKRSRVKSSLEGGDYLDILQAANAFWAALAEYYYGLFYNSPRAKMRGTIVLLLMLTGLRNQELCDLQLRDLPFKHNKNEITVRKGKGRKGGSVVITPWTRRFLDKIVGQKSRLGDTEWLLRNEAGKKFETVNIRQIVAGFGRNTNWAFIRPHKLRHTYGSIVYFLTKDLRFVQKQLRHASSSTTDIYVDVIMAKVTDNAPEYIKSFLVAINPKAEENILTL